MALNSFDIVSEVELPELMNAVDQAQREIKNRYDFKGSNAEIELDKNEMNLKITAEDEMKLKTVIDILLTKMAKRSVPTKSLVYGKTEPTGRVLKKELQIQQGLEKDNCKQVIQFLKGHDKKLQTQIMGEQIRVSSKNRDDLQKAIQALKGADFSFDLQFTNYR